jgi:hypothetical protein
VVSARCLGALKGYRGRFAAANAQCGNASLLAMLL